MQPNQPPPAPPPASPPASNGPEKPLNPYDFLSAKPQKPKNTILPTGNSTMQRVLIVLGIIVFLIIAVIIFINVLGSAGKENTNSLIDVVKQQNELVRVANIGLDKSKLNPTQNLALTTKLSVMSDQPALLDAIKASGTKLDPNAVLPGDANTDASLAKADQDNNFENVFLQILDNDLIKYQAALKKSYSSVSGKNLKDALNVDYEHINLILGTQDK